MSDSNITPNVNPNAGAASTGSANAGYAQGGYAAAPSSDAMPRSTRSASSSIFPAVPAANAAGAQNAAAGAAPSGEFAARSGEFAASGRAPRSAHSEAPRVAGAAIGATPGLAAPVHSTLESVPATHSAHRPAVSGSEGTSDAQRHHKVPRARRMKLSLTRIDPWSATKVGFMLSFAISLILLVALSVAWSVFMGSNAMNSINSLVSSSGLDSMTSSFSSIFSTGHVISVLAILGVFNTVLWTLLAAIFAFLYNITARLVGGLRVTLGDD
ncbi:MAG: DUF3566 domain-containing protein [Bifidobacteriaceae bacterium]|nr:DUF3566 domain-containing protein [Bifidobacteriaceae bacterium]